MVTRSLTDLWPFFALEVRTPHVTLTYITDDMIPALVALADDGIHPAGSSPFSTSWSLEPPDQRATSMAQFYWHSRSTITPDAWHLTFAVVVDGTIVGSQDAFAKDFHKTKAVTTGSWLAQSHQGRGIGTEMRRAMLHLLFEGLGTKVAHTEAFESNLASRRVTEKLGYQSNGSSIELRGDDVAERSIRYRMEQDQWATIQQDDISIEGLASCLSTLGLDSQTTT